MANDQKDLQEKMDKIMAAIANRNNNNWGEV
jgi:hypothetical protein